VNKMTVEGGATDAAAQAMVECQNEYVIRFCHVMTGLVLSFNNPDAREALRVAGFDVDARWGDNGFEVLITFIDRGGRTRIP